MGIRRLVGTATVGSPAQSGSSVDGVEGLASVDFSGTASTRFTINSEPLILADAGVTVNGSSPAVAVETTSGYTSIQTSGWSAYQARNSRTKNGMMIDLPFWAGNAVSNGWDDYNSKYYGDHYVDSLNICPSKSGNAAIPTDIAAAKAAGLVPNVSDYDHSFTMVKAVSIDGDPTLYSAVQNNQSPTGVPVGIRAWEYFCVVDSLPPDNTYFRPPLRGWDGSWSNWYKDSDFDYTRLFDAAATTTFTNSEGTIPATADLNGVPHTVEPVWISTLNYDIRGAIACDQHHGYATNFGKRCGEDVLSLFSDDTSSQKIANARKIIQKGLDWVFTHAYRTNGFYVDGPIASIALVSFLLKDSAKRTAFDALANRDPFTEQVYGREQQRHNYVTTAMTQITEPDTAGENNRERNHILDPIYAGIDYPNWSLVKSAPIAPDNYEDTYWNINSTYNSLSVSASISTAFAIHCMRSVQSDIFDRLGLAPWRDNLDRYYWMTHEAKDYANGLCQMTADNSNKAESYQTLDLFRTMVGANYRTLQDLVYAAGGLNYSPWTGRPQQAVPPEVALSGSDIVITQAPLLGYMGNDITQVDLRYNIDGGAWTEVSDISWIGTNPATHTLGTYTLAAATHGATTGERVRVQYRNHNSAGVGAWSSNLSVRYVYADGYFGDDTHASVIIP